MAKMSEKMKQELKAEKAYNKKHKRMYRLTANDVCLLYTSDAADEL